MGLTSTFFGLEIANSGMRAYQTALSTTAHNLANTATTGYSKQTVGMNAARALGGAGSYGMIGAGVDIAGITTSRSAYYDIKYRQSSTSSTEYDTKSYYLQCMESYIYVDDTDAAGITTSFDNFYKAMTDLTSDASDTTKRTSAVEYATTFTTYVNTVANQLVTLQEEVNSEIKMAVTQINALGEQIASLTKQINLLEVNGVSTANDLRDQRNVLVDELSKYCDVSVNEVIPKEESGIPQYTVSVAGGLLVDGGKVTKLSLVQNSRKGNINDLSGLYDITWSTGQTFDIRNSSLGGSLQALFEIRDGNNGENLNGKFTGLSQNAAGNTVVTLTSTNCDNAATLNIPSSAGTITVQGHDYTYDSFDVTVDANGKYTYNFILNEETTSQELGALTNSYSTGTTADVGDSVEYKGIPYYMSQLNTFARTFAQAFNKVHNAGYDMEGNAGLDVFTATDGVDGIQYSFTEDGNKSDFSSLATALDANGYHIGSYYNITCLNFDTTKEVEADPKKLALKATASEGNSGYGNLSKLVDLKDDATMFTHGAPDSYLQTLVATLGVDSQAATSLGKSQNNIKNSIQSRRLSLSGVDQDEEGVDLVKFQNLLFNQYKVLSVMDEVYDKLINGTAV